MKKTASVAPVPSPTEVPAIDQVKLAFQGGYTRQQIQTQLDKVMKLYGYETSDLNYKKCASTLVAMRQECGADEMVIIDRMIKLKAGLGDTALTFPDAAALVATEIKIDQ